MSTIIEAIDTLNSAKHLFFAAQMAASDIDDRHQRSALESVLIEASAKKLPYVAGF